MALIKATYNAITAIPPYKEKIILVKKYNKDSLAKFKIKEYNTTNRVNLPNLNLLTLPKNKFSSCEYIYDFMKRKKTALYIVGVNDEESSAK